jgi:2-polyprenyl-3-methyl-5-hydroxy-6-metoxy-1,4-benzoquinol methylase
MKIKNMEEAEFRIRNEELSRKFDIEQYHRKSHFLIRLMIFLRFMAVKTMAGRDCSTLLDIGCGNGYLLSTVSSEKKYGIDLSLNNIMKAKQRLNSVAHCVLAQGNAESLPFKEASFDTVICSEVIEHVLRPEHVLQEAKRALKPEGLLVITIPNDNLINKCRGIIKALHLGGIISTKFGGGEEWHLHIFNENQIKDLMVSLGFQVVRMKKLPFSILPLHYILKCQKA